MYPKEFKGWKKIWVKNKILFLAPEEMLSSEKMLDLYLGPLEKFPEVVCSLFDSEFIVVQLGLGLS